MWTASPDGPALAVAALGAGATALWGDRERGVVWAVGVALLVLAILTGFGAHRQVGRLTTGWDEYWADREIEIGELVSEELDRRLASGEAGADVLADRAIDVGELPDQDFVRGLRERHSAAAMALYDPVGRPVVWDGMHWGKIPEEVQAGQFRYAYQDRPLFGYLYVTAVGTDGGVAVASYLLRADLPEALNADVEDFASRFFAETGERIRVFQDDPGTTEGVWDLDLPDRRLLSVRLERPDPAVRAAQVLARWRWTVAGLTALAWLLLAIGGAPRLATATTAAAGLLALVAWFPFDELTGLGSLFDPTVYQLSGPVTLTLGRVALVAIAGFTLIAVLPRPAFRIPAWAAGLAAGVAFPVVLAWIRTGAAPTGLAVGRIEWVVYEIAAAAALTLLVGTALVFTREGRGSRPMALAGTVAAMALGAGAGGWVWLTASQPTWWSALWALPVGLAAAGLRAWGGWQRPLMSWTIAAVLGGTAAIPVTWAHRVESRMLSGAQRLGELAAPDDPDLAQRLLSVADMVDSLHAASRDDVGLLYSAWRESGVAEAGYPVRLTMWGVDGLRGEELRAGVGDEVTEILGSVVAEGSSAEGPTLFRLDRHDARYILTAPLADGRLMSIVAPPFVEGARPSALAPFVRGERSDDLDPLSFIPLLADDPRTTEELVWRRTRTGWQAEALLTFQNDRAYHAHYALDLPNALQGTARATLLLALNLALFSVFWLAGRGLLRDLIRPEMRLSGLVISFRSRVTLALFGFFALANALFGTVAYRTLAEASHRSARVIAERVADDAASWYRALGGGMERLARQVNAELIEYRDGELREGSVEELVELGLYEGWTPLEIHELLDGREGLREFTETSVGGWQYVTAYRRLPDGDILGAQVPLQAGTEAIQSTDIIELLGFVIMVGAALSLALAMMAGRALTRPIQALQVASERVGSGNLALQLPSERTDEFGAVFRAFNRMVARVRRARRQLVRTSRRTQAIMDEAAVGMVALDPAGNVTLVNPRAEELLGHEVFVGRPIPNEDVLGQELTEWLGEYLEGSADRVDAELQTGERRLRLRARRLGSQGARRGVVLAMDDVTDELRAERVLAWGEMARQVAHEVKNPLTPIKLSIQHVRRAWDDKRPDFDEILVRNVDAMLKEIDRLAGIAQSFSRFGAPGGDEPAPLTEVSVEQVVVEVMALYGGGAAPVRFEHTIEPELPTVVARPAELKEALVNLLENARVAGEEGGVVSMVARRGDEGTVLLGVEDDGAGIPEDVLPRIFEPKFSTRSTGAGLGLPIVQRLVLGWGGRIDVKSEVGQGTTVQLTLREWISEGGSGVGGGPSEATD